MVSRLKVLSDSLRQSVLGSKNEDGTHTVMMDKDAFINRVRGYQDLAERMRQLQHQRMRTYQM